MTQQSKTLGVDVAKRQLDYSFGKGLKSGAVPNTAEGHAKLVKLCAKHPGIRVICEATGGYEKAMVKALRKAKITTHVVMPLRVRSYAIAEGTMAKTDRIDAQLLARFGQKVELAKHCEPSPFLEQLRELVDCRRHLAERLTELACKRENAGERTLRMLDDESEKLVELKTQLEREIGQLVEKDKEWSAKIARMQKVEGVGPVVAVSMCALVPELGTIGDKAVSSLVGLAPHPNQSGASERPRRVKDGRRHVRSVLYMAALTTIRCNPILRKFHQRLKKKGKHGYVCLVAVMRKLICLLNQICADPKFTLA
jgi:transposase